MYLSFLVRLLCEMMTVCQPSILIFMSYVRIICQHILLIKGSPLSLENWPFNDLTSGKLTKVNSISDFKWILLEIAFSRLSPIVHASVFACWAVRRSLTMRREEPLWLGDDYCRWSMSTREFRRSIISTEQEVGDPWLFIGCPCGAKS